MIINKGHKVILFLLFNIAVNTTYAQTVFEYPKDLKSNVLYVPLMEYISIPAHIPVTPVQKREYDKVVKKNKQITRANERITQIITDTYPFKFEMISLEKLKSKDSTIYVLESFSQLTKKMAYYYKDNIEMLDELMDETENRPHHFKDVYLYYYITLNKTEKEFIMVDFGKKNIPQALRYFSKSVGAYFDAL